MNRLQRSIVNAAVAVLVLGMPLEALAIQCRISVNPINFGVYQPLTPVHLDVTGQIQVRCQAQPGTFSVIIGPGISGNQLARTLSAGGGNILFYNLFRDAARSQIWGDGTPPSFVVTGSRTGSGRPTLYNYPVYGRIYADQAPDPGLYNDNLVVTVLF